MPTSERAAQRSWAAEPADGLTARPNGADTPGAAGRFFRLGLVRALWVPLGILAISGLVAAAFWPGHMSADTLSQIEQVRDGHFSDQWAPILGWLWSIVWPLGVGPGWILAAQVITFVSGLYLLLRSALPRVGALLASAFVALCPPVFGYLGYLGRDTWFTVFLILTFGLLAAAARSSGRTRSALLGGSLAASWLTLTTRQNAAAAVAVALVVFVWLTPPLARRLDRLRRPLLQVLGSCVVAVAITLALMASQVGLNQAIGTQASYPQQQLYIYDLAALSTHDGKNLFPSDVYRGNVKALGSTWSPDSIVGLLFTPEPLIHVPLAAGPRGDLTHRWRHEVVSHPFSYLHERWTLWMRQLGVTRAPLWIYHPGIDPNQFGYQLRFASLDSVVRDYERAFASDSNLDGTVVQRAWIYLLIALVGGIVLVRWRPSRAVLVVAAFAFSAWTYQVGLFFGAMGTQYRFEYPVVVTGLVTAFVVASVGWGRLRARRERSATSG